MNKLIAVLAAVMLSGCAAATYKVHPGAGGYVSGVASTAQIFDSQEYDALVGANAVIQQVQADYLANKFPTSSMPAIRTAANAATTAYNTAQAQWLAFDGALKSGGTPSQAALISAVSAMTAAVAQLTTAKGGA
jgi:uncharacterized protein YceK